VEVRAVAIVGAVLGAKALLRGPRLDQRAIDGEVLVRHEPLGLLVDFGKELLRHLGGQQPVAVLRKHRMVPHRVVHAQAHKPAEQQVVVDLLDQQPLRAHRVEHLQQQRPQNVLRRNRWPPGVGIQRIELRAQRPQHRVRQLANRSQRMILRHTLLQRNIAEHPVLNPLVSTHTC
jgi:hypothetical protein